ncbi:hypothetical protein M569_10517, partial [Genlisea aurea]
MNRGVPDRILQDVNGDHLRNHVHLTNCIHLKNQMHKHSPIMDDKAIMRELVVLQRSKSLRDPSASPHSGSIFDMFVNRQRRDEFVSGRRSIGIENPLETDGIASPAVVELQASKLDVGRVNQKRRTKKEKSGSRFPQAGKSESRSKSIEPKCTANGQDKRRIKSPSPRLKDVIAEGDGNRSLEQVQQEGEVHFRHSKSPNRTSKRRKFRATRRGGRPSVSTRDQEVSGVPRNGCGIPWNWSRIHDRGKSFLDMAGRSLSCGLSESRAKCGMALPEMPPLSENSNSSPKQEADVLPLLFDALGSQGSADRAAWFRDYSGELGIFSDNLVKHHGTDSDLVSEGKRGMHQNLSQKYMPRTFRDMIGQPLVVQALSNAISKRRIGLLYLFYGPHGTGKTSCARIFARALNCMSTEHSKPCGACNTCTASGKNQNVREIGHMNVESVTELIEHMVASRSHSRYRVFIFDECDTLSPECWNVMLKVIDLAPRRVVFVLVCSMLDAVPNVIISRCQKFFFPKLKDADIVHGLQRIVSKEGLEIDKEAVKLIASRSDGSLRDAEMTLEQLSLIGKRISLGLVQELVGLISDEKLVDLLDLALSADTVNTVKNLRDIMEFGVEPLALMSQLATVITDILAGSFDFSKGKPKRKFFRRQSLSKDEMLRLRQALKTLSEAEKQLRVSTDRTTWLTAAVLQLAPDQQYAGSSGDDSAADAAAIPRMNPEAIRNSVGPKGKVGKSRSDEVRNREIDEIWLQVLEKIPMNVVREFMYQEANLVSLSYGAAAPTAQLDFASPLMKSKAEKFRIHILKAFESVLGSPVTIEIRYESRKRNSSPPLLLAAAASTSGVKKSREIVEIEGSTPNRRLVRGKVSLAHVIQQADSTKKNDDNGGWSKRKAVSIAEKLEQQNLRLESKSRRLSCW